MEQNLLIKQLKQLVVFLEHNKSLETAGFSVVKLSSSQLNKLEAVFSVKLRRNLAGYSELPHRQPNRKILVDFLGVV